MSARRDDGSGQRLETLAIHAGQEPDAVNGAVMTPIVLSSTFAQPEPGKPLSYDYSRSGNPTRKPHSKVVSRRSKAEAVGSRSQAAAQPRRRCFTPCDRAITSCVGMTFTAVRTASSVKCSSPWASKPRSRICAHPPDSSVR